MTVYHFDVARRPKVKQRPRTTTKNGRTWSYTPKETAAFEAHVAEEYMRQGYPKIDGPVSVNVILYDDSFSVWITPLGDAKSKLRGDLDNYTKAILDALNGIAWQDDKQVFELKVVKMSQTTLDNEEQS